jgi:hypothetical protein
VIELGEVRSEADGYLRRCVVGYGMAQFDAGKVSTLLDRLATLGIPMEMVHSVDEQNGHAHVIFRNKDTYKGGWTDGKMNGYGTFRKNEVQKNQYEWQFYGQFKDDCATSGQLSTPLDPDGEARLHGSGKKPVYEWIPFPPADAPPGERYTRTQDGEVTPERAEEIRKFNELQEKKKAREKANEEETEKSRKADKDKQNFIDLWNDPIHKKWGS